MGSGGILIVGYRHEYYDRGTPAVGAARQGVSIIMRTRRHISSRGLLTIVGALLAVGSYAREIDPPGIPVIFTDDVPSAGITFKHYSAATPEKYLIETMGSGCGWIDFDQDGLLDLYLANSAETRIYKPKEPLRGALYRNSGDGTFTDVTSKAGVGAEGLFAMGVAVGDYDNDGYPDLLVLGYGRSILYRNNGEGTFTDMTAKAGVENRGRWASSAAWFDYNNDGKLDLLIVNYVDWTPESDYWCGERGPGKRSYCHPNNYDAQPPTLYRNNGDGTFTDVSESSEVGRKGGNGLGVVTFDFDNDGWQDIFVANDAMPNFLFHNNRDGTFSEIGYLAGVAVSLDGSPESGMGTDAADVTGNGLLDIAVSHLDSQLARLYRNMGGQIFEDVTLLSKMGYTTYNMSEFGLRFMDYDNDGARDLFMATGHVMDNIELYRESVYYAEPKLMFRNKGHGIFENVSERLGPDFNQPRVSRSAAVGDFDNDGDLDILVNHCDQTPQLLRNDGGNANHWLEILLIGTRSNRDGVGARVKVVAGDLVVHDQRKGGMSYQAAQDPRLHFGLGQHANVDSVEILWPSGVVTKLSNLKSNQILAVRECEGLVVRCFPNVASR